MMNKQSLEVAREHAQAARTYLDRLMAEPRNGPDLQQHWFGFLTEWNRAFNKIQHGAKQGTSSAWAGRIMHDLKSDELLCYLKNARDAHEHGIKKVAVQQGELQPFAHNEPKPLVWITLKSEDGTETRIGGPEVPWARLVNIKIRLEAAINRGRTYNPPKTHFGSTLDEVTPEAVGQLALTYLDQKICEGLALSQ